jgi:hypothetical protein
MQVAVAFVYIEKREVALSATSAIRIEWRLFHIQEELYNDDYGFTGLYSILEIGLYFLLVAPNCDLTWDIMPRKALTNQF